MKERIEKIKDFLADSTTISNRELVLAIAVGVFRRYGIWFADFPEKVCHDRKP